MHDHLRDRMVEITPEEFEVFCKMVLVRRLDAWSLQVTAFQQDEGIDIEGVIDEGIFRALLGVQVKRYSEGNTVSQPSVHQFRGALTQGDHQVGTYITSSSFTAPAVEAAEQLQICLVDGETLASVMVENEIGIEESSGSYEIQAEFWRAFEEPTEDDRIPATEVPLADTIEGLRLYLEAIAETDGSESEMHRYVSDNLDAEYTERHANMNATAGWLLGFVHRETPTDVNGRTVQRWGLTREGSKYLALHDSGDEASAEAKLVDAIRNVEIIERIYAELDAEGELTNDELRQVLDRETHISGTSIERRASTVVKWLTMLPEVVERSHGRSKKFVRV
jgi:restriction system protein